LDKRDALSFAQIGNRNRLPVIMVSCCCVRTTIFIFSTFRP